MATPRRSRKTGTRGGQRTGRPSAKPDSHETNEAGEHDLDRDDQEWPDQKEPRPEEVLENYPLDRPHERHRRTRYTPFIVLRYGAADTGARPLAPGTTFWHSPDVFVISSAGANVPVAGEENRIFARVNNRGIKDAAGVIVRYWWANPSLAITEANAHLIGTATAFVPSNYSVVVECKDAWIPIVENGGHECVFAEAWVPYFDPIGAPLDPVSDRHVCQRNLHVIEVAAGAEFSFALEAANLVGSEARVTFHVEPMSARSAHARLSAKDVAYKGHLVTKQGVLPLALEVSASGPSAMIPNQTFPRRQLAWAKLAAHQEPRGESRPLATMARTVTLAPWEMRTLTISGRVPRDALRGQIFAFDVSQRIDETITGGYTLYVVAAV